MSDQYDRYFRFYDNREKGLWFVEESFNVAKVGA